MEYYIGQIFEGSYPPEAAIWCNANNAYIKKIRDHIYEIKAVPKPTEEEIKQIRIAELKERLNGTDYVVIKIAEAETIEEQDILREYYSDVIINRKSWREEINSLEQ